MFFGSFEFDFPNFGDLRNLSLKDVIRLLQQALGLLVGEGDDDTVESCSGGLLGKKIGGNNVFTEKVCAFAMQLWFCDVTLPIY